jgi:hypothetical protein
MNNLNLKAVLRISYLMEKVIFISKNPNIFIREYLKMVYITIKMDYCSVINTFIEVSL